MELSEKLQELGACEDAILWAAGKTLQEAWQTCPRGDWMLWLIEEAGMCQHTQIVLCAAKCAQTALAHMDDRGKKCVAAALAYAKTGVMPEAAADIFSDAWRAVEEAKGPKEKHASEAAAWAIGAIWPKNENAASWAAFEAQAIAGKKSRKCASIVRALVKTPSF